MSSLRPGVTKQHKTNKQTNFLRVFVPNNTDDDEKVELVVFITSWAKGVYVFGSVGLSVCLSVRNIRVYSKVLNGLE